MGTHVRVRRGIRLHRAQRQTHRRQGVVVHGTEPPGQHRNGHLRRRHPATRPHPSPAQPRHPRTAVPLQPLPRLRRTGPGTPGIGAGDHRRSRNEGQRVPHDRRTGRPRPRRRAGPRRNRRGRHGWRGDAARAVENSQPAAGPRPQPVGPAGRVHGPFRPDVRTSDGQIEGGHGLLPLEPVHRRQRGRLRPEHHRHQPGRLPRLLSHPGRRLAHQHDNPVHPRHETQRGRPRPTGGPHRVSTRMGAVHRRTAGRHLRAASCAARRRHGAVLVADPRSHLDAARHGGGRRGDLRRPSLAIPDQGHAGIETPHQLDRPRRSLRVGGHASPPRRWGPHWKRSQN